MHRLHLFSLCCSPHLPVRVIPSSSLGFAREQRESQPFAWEAKEYLRQRLVGRKVKITVEYKRNLPAQGGGREEPREYVTVYAGKKYVGVAYLIHILVEV